MPPERMPKRAHEQDDSVPAPVWACANCRYPIHEEEGGAFTDDERTLCASCADALAEHAAGLEGE